MPLSDEDEMGLYEAFLKEPRSGLVQAPKDGSPSVEFCFGGGWRECRIWAGYLDASRVLLREILREGQRVDNLIFPALFNLRHGLEVALKWHIQHAGAAVPKRIGHDLDALINLFRETVANLDSKLLDYAEGGLGDISDLAAIDPHSVAFRYATEIDGSPIEIRPKQWDVAHLYFAADALMIWLDELSRHIEEAQRKALEADAV